MDAAVTAAAGLVIAAGLALQILYLHLRQRRRRRRVSSLVIEPHPSLQEQEVALKAALQGVSRTSVASLIKGHGLDLVSLELLAEANPDTPRRPYNNNVIFLVAVASGPEGGASELILRASNPHPWRTRRGTENEVAVLQWLAHHDVPLTPRVVDFCLDASASPLGCEFILMTRVPGTPLRQIMPELSPEKRLDVADQLRDWLGLLQQVPRPDGGSGPMSALRLRGGAVVCGGAAVLADGPKLPTWSCEGFAAYAEAVLCDAIVRLGDAAEPSRRILGKELERVLDQHVEAYRVSFERRSAPQGYSRLCHNDLGLDNLLYEDGRLSGVVDWEGAGWGFADKDCLGFLEVAGGGLPDAGDCGSGLPVGPGARQRRCLLRLLKEVPSLFFFSATWYGGLADERERQLAAMNEGLRAEAAVRGAIARLGADVGR